ncbi:hypothetical protein [Yeosuana marina]|uniref:hypothetical protein n=1 Tax=Yeosuana marina TaxID=1565536 RepID=UPI0030EB9D20|tara:strand:- start:1100 stop:1663 length:564 start_codon:yes stop_codon:yes gene_type:complete
MKHIIPILILVLFSASCGNDSKKTEGSAGSDNQVHEKELSIDSEDLKELLSKKTPFTEAEIKEAFPKSINGFPLDGTVKVTNQQGLGVYGNDEITLKIYDCAGSKSGMASLFNTVYNIKTQDDDETQYLNKERNGIKTKSTYRTDANRSDIIFLYHNRWYVVISGKSMNPDELWKAFDINDLKNFKK